MELTKKEQKDVFRDLPLEDSMSPFDPLPGNYIPTPLPGKGPVTYDPVLSLGRRSRASIENTLHIRRMNKELQKERYRDQNDENN